MAASVVAPAIVATRGIRRRDASWNSSPRRSATRIRVWRIIPNFRTIDSSRGPLPVMARPRAGHAERHTIARLGTINRGKRLSLDRPAAPDGPVEPSHDEGEKPCRESIVRAVGITCRRVFDWCDCHKIRTLIDTAPLHVATYIETMQTGFKKPSVEQHLAGGSSSRATRPGLRRHLTAVAQAGRLAR